MRRKVCELRSRESRGGEQHETNVCHEPEIPGKILEQQTKMLVGRRAGATINSQPLGRIVAGTKCDLFFILHATTPERAIRSLRIQPLALQG
jgi:hypothetical protein